MLVTRQMTGAIDFHSTKKILWKSMVAINCLVTNILRYYNISYFVFIRRNKFIQFWNNTRVS